ncbi:hypothetical protein XENOCAPTIV_008392, partial [Xenoophorus captivus]
LCALSLAVEQTRACRKLISAQGRGRYLLRLALSRKTLSQYLSGRVFVLDLVPGSQAHVDMFVSSGDIIDEINGTSLRNSKPGQAGVVLSRLKSCPLSIRILRCRAQDGTVYRPLVKLLRALRMENPNVQLGLSSLQKQANNNQMSPGASQCLKEGRQVCTPLISSFRFDFSSLTLQSLNRIVYIVKFLGKANIGMVITCVWIVIKCCLHLLKLV